MDQKPVQRMAAGFQLVTYSRGVATGGISVFIPPNQSTEFLCACFVSLTQDK